jgi:hypothetical protein
LFLIGFYGVRSKKKFESHTIKKTVAYATNVIVLIFGLQRRRKRFKFVSLKLERAMKFLAQYYILLNGDDKETIRETKQFVYPTLDKVKIAVIEDVIESVKNGWVHTNGPTTYGIPPHNIKEISVSIAEIEEDDNE